MPCGREICSIGPVIILGVMFTAIISASSKYIISNVSGFGKWQIISFQLVEFSIGQIIKITILIQNLKTKSL